MKRALLVASLVLTACEGMIPTQPEPPDPVNPCDGLETLTAQVVPDTIHVNGAANVIAAGGTGRYRYRVDSVTPVGTISGNRYVAGMTPGSDSILVTDDCDNSARVGVDVIASFAVQPSRARVKPGTKFQFKYSGALTVTFSPQMLGSTGAIDAQGDYTAGAIEGTDIIIAKDTATGDTIASVVEVSDDAFFRPAYARLALPTGSFAPLAVSDGTGVVTWSLRPNDPGSVELRDDTWVYVSPDGGAGGQDAVLTAFDTILDAGTQLRVRVLTETLRTDLTPQGHRTDLGTLLTADFDGDGIDDVALAVPESDLGRSQGGAVFVFKGTSTGLPDTPTWVLKGTSDTAALGTVMAAGDLNDDGKADLALSAPGDDITLNNSGAVYLYTFDVDGPKLLRDPLTGLGAANFGTALAIRDIDGDGDDDLIVGSPGADVGGGSARGVIDIFRITPGVPIGDLGDLRLSGVDLNVDAGFAKVNTLNAGRSVVAADLNGDARTDLAFVTSLNNTLQPDGGMRTQKVFAIQVHLGREGSKPYDDLPDLFVEPANGSDLGNENGPWRVDFLPAGGGRPPLLVAYNDSVTSPDLRAGDAGVQGGTRAGAAYLFDLSGATKRPDGSQTPAQIQRTEAWSRVFGNSANIRAGRFAVLDADGDSQPELALGAFGANGTGLSADGGTVTIASSGRIDFYAMSKLSPGAVVNRPDFTRSGANRSDRIGAALTVWNGKLATFACRATTSQGDFTGRLDVFTPATGDPRNWVTQAIAVPAKVGGQQFGTNIEVGARGGHLTAIVNVPFWNGPGFDNLGGDVPSGRAWMWDLPAPATPLQLTEGTDGTVYVNDAGVRAYGGNNQARDVAFTDFNGDTYEDAVVAAGRFQHPARLADGGLNSTEYANARPECGAPTSDRYGASLVFLGSADGTMREGFRVWGPRVIAGCSQPDGGTTECLRNGMGSGLVGRFDFNGDLIQDLAMLRSNGFEVFTGRPAEDPQLAKPSLACDPYFSFPYTPYATSAPASLGDLDGDGCDEMTFRYTGTAPGNVTRQGIVIVYGFGSACNSMNARWLRISGDTEVGVSPVRLGVAMARAKDVLADGRDAVAVTADLFSVAGDPQPAVLLLPVTQLNAQKPASGEKLLAIQGSAQLTPVPLVGLKYTLSFGRSLVGGLDVDGDGKQDLVVSAPGASENGDGTGAVYVFAGGTVKEGKNQPAMIIFPDAEERASFGQDLSLVAPKGGAPAGLGIGAPLSERWGTANGSAWVLPLDF